MKLYHQPWSPNCQKPLIAINELSVTDDVEIIHYNPFEVREDWFLDLNPAHKVPVLVDGETVLWESASIVMHLATKYGGLLPADERDRGTAATLLAYESCNIAPTIGGEGLFGEMYKPADQKDAGYLARMQERLAGRLPVLDTILADGRDYFARSFSVADIQIYPGMSKVVELDTPPSPVRLKAWAKRVGGRPAVQKVYQEVAEAMGGS